MGRTVWAERYQSLGEVSTKVKDRMKRICKIPWHPHRPVEEHSSQSKQGQVCDESTSILEKHSS